jgi:hypothetical protein
MKKVITNSNLSDEEKEDLGMAVLMADLDWEGEITLEDLIEKLQNKGIEYTEFVSKEEVFSKLRKSK